MYVYICKQQVCKDQPCLHKLELKPISGFIGYLLEIHYQIHGFKLVYKVYILVRPWPDCLGGSPSHAVVKKQQILNSVSIEKCHL